MMILLTALVTIQLLYQPFLVYRNTDSIKAALTFLGIGLVLFLTFPNKINVYMQFVIVAHFIYTIIKYIIDKTPKKSKVGRYIPQEERNDEKLYLESDLGTIEVANPYRSILVSGGAGSGKSKSIFYPFIRQFMTSEYSGILYDFKSPELTEFAYSEYKKISNSKVDFKILDFKNPNKSNKCNPLSPRYITKQAIAIEI